MSMERYARNANIRFAKPHVSGFITSFSFEIRYVTIFTLRKKGSLFAPQSRKVQLFVSGIAAEPQTKWEA
jgi:hypothetical protein